MYDQAEKDHIFVSRNIIMSNPEHVYHPEYDLISLNNSIELNIAQQHSEKERRRIQRLDPIAFVENNQGLDILAFIEELSSSQRHLSSEVDLND